VFLCSSRPLLPLSRKHVNRRKKILACSSIAGPDSSLPVPSFLLRKFSAMTCGCCSPKSAAVDDLVLHNPLPHAQPFIINSLSSRRPEPFLVDPSPRCAVRTFVHRARPCGP